MDILLTTDERSKSKVEFTHALPGKEEEGEANMDEQYMRRCIQLARNGQQNAQPNPMVGAVIVHDGHIIGEGYHVRCGEGHAEVNACASVSKEDEHLLTSSTIYVSLEPCSHYGKTPPCADLLIRKGFRRCVIGCQDPFAKVQGRGIQKLRDAGMEVTVGVLEKECRELNKRFFTYHSKHRPFVTLKWAESPDGYIDGHISNTYTQMLCHKRRAEHQAILVGHRTYDIDHPQLNVRAWYGPSPKKYVVANTPVDNLQEGFTLIQTHDIPTLLTRLYEDGVQTLLVEGGARLLQSFIDAQLWDECYREIGTTPINGKGPAPHLPASIVATETTTWNGNQVERYINQ